MSKQTMMKWSKYLSSLLLIGPLSTSMICSAFQVGSTCIPPYSRSLQTSLLAKPARGNAVDSFQTVSVNCSKCSLRLFRYKKKNGTKSNLVKCFVERISEDSAGILQAQEDSGMPSESYTWCCPQCETNFARSAMMRGLPALKLVGGKVRMTKK